MDSSTSSLVDIFEIYRRFCDIRLREVTNSREMLGQLMKLVELRWQSSAVFDDLAKLMSHLDLTVDSCRFTCFYDFVFFLCRENGQKNITVSKAIAAWRLVLTGRFRLLNEWCNFVEKHQRFNISEDTWQQVLAFSRCVHEDLEGYDPKGAWPVLIDEFVEHMHRITLSNNCSTRSCSCNCCDPEAKPCIADDGFPGLKVFSGLKRKSITSFGRHMVESSNSLYPNSWNFDPLFSSKRSRHNNLDDKPEPFETTPSGDATEDYMEIVKHSSPLGSACTVEGSLSEGFAGLLSTGPCLQFNQKRRVPYT